MPFALYDQDWANFFMNDTASIRISKYLITDA